MPPQPPYTLMRTLRLAAFLPLAALVVACTPADETPAATPRAIGHLFLDTLSGVALDLPTNWRGRYELQREISDPVSGLNHQLTMRFIRADSSVDADSAMMVALVFDNEAWDSIVADSAAGRFGQAVSRDEDETLVMRRATGNPFTPGTVDALAFDSLMVAFYRRPLRASLRANVVNDQRDPDEPAPSSP